MTFWPSCHHREHGMRVFATVGTTAFDALVTTLTSPEGLSTLSGLRYDTLVLQTGRGLWTPPDVVPARFTCQQYDFKPTLAEDMSNADVVISHAGAGSIMESLRMGRRLVVVINEALMGNHQRELAGALERDGYLVCATCATLFDVLSTADFAALKRYPSPDLDALPRLVDQEMGWVHDE